MQCFARYIQHAFCKLDHQLWLFLKLTAVANISATIYSLQHALLYIQLGAGIHSNVHLDPLAFHYDL